MFPEFFGCNNPINIIILIAIFTEQKYKSKIKFIYDICIFKLNYSSKILVVKESFYTNFNK